MSIAIDLLTDELLELQEEYHQFKTDKTIGDEEEQTYLAQIDELEEAIEILEQHEKGVN